MITNNSSNQLSFHHTKFIFSELNTDFAKYKFTWYLLMFPISPSVLIIFFIVRYRFLWYIWCFHKLPFNFSWIIFQYLLHFPVFVFLLQPQHLLSFKLQSPLFNSDTICHTCSTYVSLNKRRHSKPFFFSWN